MKRSIRSTVACSAILIALAGCNGTDSKIEPKLQNAEGKAPLKRVGTQSPQGDPADAPKAKPTGAGQKAATSDY